MQKYGVSNSSWSRMICAPWSAALRARRSARAMLASTSHSHAIWVAATVTRRVKLLVLMQVIPMDSGLGRDGADRHLLVALPLRLLPAHVDGGNDHADRHDRDDDGGERVDLRIEAEADLGKHDLRERRGAGAIGEGGDNQVVQRDGETEQPAGNDRRRHD